MANSLTHIKIYGWVKIVLGIVSFCLQVYIAANYQDRYANVAAGIWGGLIFLLTGATTIYTLNNITSPSIKKLMTAIVGLSVLTLICGAVLVGLSAKAIHLYDSLCDSITVCQTRIGLDAALIACGAGCILTSWGLLYNIKTSNPLS